MKKMIKLGIKDKKLLYELERNARQPNTVLGRKIGLKSDVIQYHIKKLEKQEVITNYLTYINFHKLGFIDFGLYISLIHSTKQNKNKFIQYIKNLKNVSYFSSLGGNFDFLIGILAKDPLEFYLITNEINKQFGSQINQKEFITRISLNHFPRKYFINKKESKSFFYFGGKLESYKLDELDKKILYLLADNARMKIIEISSKLNQPHSTIISRIKKLEKANIITGYYALIASEKYGFQNYNLTIKVKNIQELEGKKLFSFCQQHKNITWFIRTIGSWDYELGVEVENQEILQELLNELREICPQIIKIELYSIFKTLKYSLYPFSE